MFSLLLAVPSCITCFGTVSSLHPTSFLMIFILVTHICTWLRMCVIMYIGLLDLADSYCEKQLKRMCERFLWQTVSVNNVTPLITVADKYKAEVNETYTF